MNTPKKGSTQLNNMKKSFLVVYALISNNNNDNYTMGIDVEYDETLMIDDKTLIIFTAILVKHRNENTKGRFKTWVYDTDEIFIKTISQI